MASIALIEKENLWQGKAQAAKIVNQLVNSPFGTLNQMDFDSALKWQPFNSAKALKYLSRGEEPTLSLQTETPIRLRGGISQSEQSNVITFGLPNKVLKEQVGLEELTEYVKTLALQLPAFWRAEIKTDGEISTFYNENRLKWVPECFGHFIKWYHLISPLAYEPFFNREELLAMPAYCVREMEQGWIEVISYEDPLSYAQPQTRQKIVEISEYLNARRHDWLTARAERPAEQLAEATVQAG